MYVPGVFINFSEAIEEKATVFDMKSTFSYSVSHTKSCRWLRGHEEQSPVALTEVPSF